MIKLGAQFLAAGIIAWFGQLQIYSLPIGGLAVVLELGELHADGVLDRRRDERRQLHRRSRRAGRGRVPHRERRVLRLLVHARARSRCQHYFNLASFIAAVLIGACIGFLPLNWSPAKLFMGDAGALMLGLLMATSAIAITGHAGSCDRGRQRRVGSSQLLGAFIPILLPVVVVLLPLLDFGLAVIRRMRAGQVALLAGPQAPSSPDAGHGPLGPRRRADLLRVDGDRQPRHSC